MSATRSNPRKLSPSRNNHVLRDSPKTADFDPRNMQTPLLVWVRADLGIGLNGSAVSTWADYSGEGNNFAQATASLQPAPTANGIGGRPGISFDGTSDQINGPSFHGMLSDPADWTLFVVGGGWTWGASVHAYYGRGMLGAPVLGSSYFYVGVTTEAGPGFGTGYWDASAHRIGYEDSAAEGQNVIVAGTSDGGEVTTRVNGSAGSTTSGATGAGVNSLATLLQIGKGNGNLNYWDGSISEVLVFDGTLSGEEINQVEQYLGDRYDIGVQG
jgi:hypothetical protein